MRRISWEGCEAFTYGVDEEGDVFFNEAEAVLVPVSLIEAFRAAQDALTAAENAIHDWVAEHEQASAR